MRTTVFIAFAAGLFSCLGLARAQDRYEDLDSARKAWSRTEVELHRIGGMGSKEAAKLLDRAEVEWRKYAVAKRAVYQALLEENGMGKDGIQSLGPGVDPEAVKASLLARREKLQHRLSVLTSAQRAAESSGQPDPLKASRLVDEIKLTRDAIATLDSSYVRADQAAKGSREYRQARTDLVTALGELAAIYRGQIVSIDTEDAEMRREFQKLRARRKPTVANQSPEGPGWKEAGDSKPARTWAGQGPRSAVRLSERDESVMFEVEADSFRCATESVTPGTFRCVSKREGGLMLRIAHAGKGLDVSWTPEREEPTRGGIAPGQARMEATR